MVDVSVVTTVYNESKSFDQAPPSILNQTYEDFEWLILDDMSDDGTAEKLYELSEQDGRITVIEAEDHLGRAKCLNRVVEEAAGDYIAQQDFDDVSFQNRLELQKDFLDNNSDTGVVGGYYERIDERRGEQYVREVPTNHDELINSLPKYIPFAHTLVMFRKEAWLDAGGYPLREDIEDLELWIEMAAAGWKLRNIPEVLGQHYVYDESSWNSRFEYADRQRNLAKVQKKAIADLDLPKWMYIYPVGRHFYPYLPSRLKKIVRKTIGRINETEV